MHTRVLLAVGLLLIVGGGLTWTLTRDDSDAAAPATTAVPPGRLRVVLTPAAGNLPLGDTISVASQVTGALGPLTPAQCELHWRDEVRGNGVFDVTTQCNGTFEYSTVQQTGMHHVIARARQTRGGAATGSGSTQVYVSS
jgi:hypothetical protein